jgi:5-methylcytosine-specific restriction endonuclease McrBC GTP-binding regulatory subunit McrB
MIHQHVTSLVLDEINRCDTASVLGELLQLFEFRGATVRLLSGRPFVLPRNLFVIGTMNSADRTIGRMDLALRRRFLWLNLYPQSEVLQTWLDRIGNNPVGFKSEALSKCNESLKSIGIAPEQHIGHALFMVQEFDVNDDTAIPQDIPLTKRHLQRIVQFSVLPYVRELFTTQFGQVDEDVIHSIRSNLLSCLEETADTESDDIEDEAQS